MFEFEVYLLFDAKPSYKIEKDCIFCYSNSEAYFLMFNIKLLQQNKRFQSQIYSPKQGSF